jgi:hypothetical protein
MNELQMVLEGRTVFEPRQWMVWKTVHILHEGRPSNIDLVLVSVSDLGFTEGASTENIYRRAQALGLELCLSEVAFGLTKFRHAKGLMIGMDPVPYPHWAGKVAVYQLETRRNSDDECTIGWATANPEERHSEFTFWVFRKSQK